MLFQLGQGSLSSSIDNSDGGKMGTFRLESKHIRFLVIGLLALSWAALPVQAAEPQLSLTILVKEALERNPEIRAARERWEARKAVTPYD